MGSIHDEQSPLTGRNRTGNLVAEIHVSRGVDEIQDVHQAIGCLVAHLDGVALDGDAALPLQVHVVQGLLLQIPVRDGAGELKQPIGQGALAVVDVGDDAEIADAFHAGMGGKQKYAETRPEWRRPIGRMEGILRRGTGATNGGLVASSLYLNFEGFFGLMLFCTYFHPPFLRAL